MWQVVILLVTLLTESSGSARPAAAEEPVDFAKQVKPILEAKCQPCHFPGGKMYAKLPFDQPSTIVTLGDQLFTRIKDEPSRAVIRGFLATSPAPSASRNQGRP